MGPGRYSFNINLLESKVQVSLYNRHHGQVSHWSKQKPLSIHAKNCCYNIIGIKNIEHILICLKIKRLKLFDVDRDAVPEDKIPGYLHEGGGCTKDQPTRSKDPGSYLHQPTCLGSGR